MVKEEFTFKKMERFGRRSKMTDTRFIILDEETKALVDEKFQFKRKLAKEKEEELFSVFDETLTEDEYWALKFLYAYMPINDLADYDGSLFLEHVRKTLEIQRTVPWGTKVPPSLFLYFVLPYRVNNENIENYRGILFDEIYPRVKDLSMEEAILETNHWCHEKATYVGSDRRTLSPLSLIRNALGRCGEQSTLAVAALRSIGIPARQVYTPLWAHTDSNHAWVEAWADGKWYFFGACEPEPKLNKGWFEKPAQRAMLIHTRVGSNYKGPEEITLAHPWFTELNLTNLYAKTKKLTVKITDQQGNPTSAKVQFQLFNFGGFRPILVMDTDESGTVSVSFGLGDVYISARGPEGWGFAKCSVKDNDEITIALSKEIPTDYVEEFAMVPPPEQPDNPNLQVSEEEQAKHNERVKQGTEIRTNYEATFLTEKDAEELAKECQLPFYRVWKVLKTARGNSREIAAFLKEFSPTYGEWSLRLLEVLNDKDLIDTFRPTLVDHLDHALKIKDELNLDEDMFAKYILRPRVDFEMLTPYRAHFLKDLGEEKVQLFRQDPAKLVEFIDQEFEVLHDINYYQGSATALGSWKLKKGDPLARAILFVAMARTVGIPARLNPSDRKPQFYLDGIWHNVEFRDQTDKEETSPAISTDSTGTVVWEVDEQMTDEVSYFKNVTIARFNDGFYQTLFFKLDPENPKLELPEGHYRLITSRRKQDGTSLVRIQYFEVKANEELKLTLIFPTYETEVPVLGKVNVDWSCQTTSGQEESISQFLGKKGTTFIWIEPEREPSKHLLREMKEMKREWDSLAVSINFFIHEDKWDTAQNLFTDEELPKNITFFKETTHNGGLQKITTDVQVGRDFPIVFVTDKLKQIRHISEGYKLGISKEVVDVYKQLENK